MKTTKAVLLSGLLAGSLLASGSAALARDNSRWDRHDRDRYERNAYGRDEMRADREALEYWRNKLQYDLRHRASRKKIAEDQANIQMLEEKISRGRNRAAWNWGRW